MLRAYFEQLLDRNRAEHEQQRFSQSTVVVAIDQAARCLQAEPELEVGDVSGLALGMGPGRLQVSTLDQPHVDPGGDQGVDVALGPHQVGLHRCPEPVGQAATGDLEHAAQNRVGAGRVLRTHLDTSTGRQRFSDCRQAVSSAARVGVDRQMGQVRRQPHVRGRDGERGGQSQVVPGDPIGRRLIAHRLTEQVDADPMTLGEQVDGGDQCFVPRAPGDIARRRPPRLRLPAWHRLDDPLETLTRRQPDNTARSNSHDTKPGTPDGGAG